MGGAEVVFNHSYLVSVVGPNGLAEPGAKLGNVHALNVVQTLDQKVQVGPSS